MDIGTGAKQNWLVLCNATTATATITGIAPRTAQANGIEVRHYDDLNEDSDSYFAGHKENDDGSASVRFVATYRGMPVEWCN